MGDSRAIASINGNVDVLSLDHKPGNDTEIKRIQAAGGWVEFNRVNGNLALSRALGDFVFKKNEKKTAEEQIVTGELINLLKKFLESYSLYYSLKANTNNIFPAELLHVHDRCVEVLLYRKTVM